MTALVTPPVRLLEQAMLRLERALDVAVLDAFFDVVYRERGRQDRLFAQLNIACGGMKLFLEALGILFFASKGSVAVRALVALGVNPWNVLIVDAYHLHLRLSLC